MPTGPVYTAEDVFEDPEVAARGMLMPVTDSEVGTYTNPGQHTATIMREILGYDNDAIRALAEEKVIQLGAWPASTMVGLQY